MMNTSPEAIALVLHQLGLRDVKVKAKKVLACSPFHDDRSPSFAVLESPPGTIPGYCCLGCGHTGKLEGLVMYFAHQLGERFWDLLSHVQERAEDRGGEDPFNMARLSSLRWVSSNHALERVKFEPVVRPHVAPTETSYRPKSNSFSSDELLAYDDEVPQYLVDRGISPDVLSWFGVMTDRRRQRAIFPIRDQLGIVHGISARSYRAACICERCDATLEKPLSACKRCGHNHPKYYHTPGMEKSILLYGELHYKTNAIPIFVEGFLDVLRPLSLGLEASPLAIMGAHPAWSQIRKISARIAPTIPIATMGDQDDAGRGMNREVDNFLRFNEPGRALITILLPPGVKDPGEMHQEHVDALNERLRLVRDSEFPLEAGARRVTIQL